MTGSTRIKAIKVLFVGTVEQEHIFRAPFISKEHDVKGIEHELRKTAPYDATRVDSFVLQTTVAGQLLGTPFHDLICSIAYG